MSGSHKDNFPLEVDVMVPFNGEDVNELRRDAWEGYSLHLTQEEAIRYLQTDPQLVLSAYCYSLDEDDAQRLVIKHFYEQLTGEKCLDPDFVREKFEASYDNKDEAWCNLPDPVCEAFFRRQFDLEEYPYWERQALKIGDWFEGKATIILKEPDAEDVARVAQRYLRLPGFSPRDAAEILRDNPSYALDVYVGRAGDTDIREALYEILGERLHMGRPWPGGTTPKTESEAFFKEFDLAVKARGWRPLDVEEAA